MFGTVIVSGLVGQLVGPASWASIVNKNFSCTTYWQQCNNTATICIGEECNESSGRAWWWFIQKIIKQNYISNSLLYLKFHCYLFHFFVIVQFFPIIIIFWNFFLSNKMGCVQEIMNMNFCIRLGTHQLINIFYLYFTLYTSWQLIYFVCFYEYLKNNCFQKLIIIITFFGICTKNRRSSVTNIYEYVFMQSSFCLWKYEGFRKQTLVCSNKKKNKKNKSKHNDSVD